MTSDLATGLRAHAARAEGRTEDALEALEDVQMDIFYQMPMASPYDGQVLERYIRGVLLQEMGRYEEALGDPARAAAQYARFVDMWRDADPELQPIVETARASLRRLVPDSES